jgi:AAA+ superfamily predicted ATPase
VIDRELQAIAARVRLALYQQIAWTESCGDGARWHDRWIERDERRAWSASDERGRELAEARARIESGLPEVAPRLKQLAEMFGLDAREVDVVEATLAAAVSPELAGTFVAACGRALPTESLIASIFDHGVRRVITPDSPLAQWELVRRIELAPGEPDGIVLDPAIVDWFTGAYAIDGALVGLAQPVAPRPPLTGWPVAEVGDRIVARWSAEVPSPLRVVVCAPPGAGRATFAAALAERLQLALIAIDAGATDDASWPSIVRRAHRHAFLTRTAIAFTGEAALRRGWPRLAAAFPLTFACCELDRMPSPAPDATDLVIELPPTTIGDRVALWRELVPAASAWNGEVEDLARRFRASPADIAHAARRAVATPAEAGSVISERTRDHLGDLAARLECPFSWDDLVLAPSVIDILRDFEYEGRVRTALWEEPGLRRLFPQGRGLFALLTGAPGTGKTMAAQVLARELGMPLYRISLATVVSKYVGETAKNLQRILSRAEHLDAVLLFDEADALFGRRTEIKDAHDRYANTDTNHLLQAIEAYAGIAILASNKRSNIDQAFTRRLRYVLDFPRPDAAQRRALWTQVLGAIAGDALAPLDRTIDALAGAIELTGAQIKYAALAAILAARRDQHPIRAVHLLRGVDRELQKDGRSLTERERALVVHAV